MYMYKNALQCLIISFYMVFGKNNVNVHTYLEQKCVTIMLKMYMH